MALTYLRPIDLDGAEPVARYLRGYRHHRGLHGASVALRNVYIHHTREDLTEAMCFGLGAGLGFTYVQDPPSGLFRVGGRGSHLASHFCNVLGIRLKAYRSDDADLAWTHARRLIDQGRLVMMDVDMFHLPYLVQLLGLDQGSHLGGHKVVLTGYDLEAETAFLGDYFWAEPQAVAVEDLKRARASADGNVAFTFDFPRRLPALRPAIVSSIQSVVRQMRCPYRDRFGGLASLARFCRQAAHWGRSFAGEPLRRLTSLAWLTLEKAGTGGGNFRILYGAFLSEAAERLGAPTLTPVAEHYRNLGELWREVAALLQASMQDPTSGLYARAPGPQRLLDEIASLELQGIGLLGDFLK